MRIDRFISSKENQPYLHYHKFNRLLEDGDFLVVDAGPDVNYYDVDISISYPATIRISFLCAPSIPHNFLPLMSWNEHITGKKMKSRTRKRSKTTCVFDESENRIHTIKAVMVATLTG